MIYFDYIAAFEPEDLVYGDILRSRATGDMFFIVGIEDLEEEVVCIDVTKAAKLGNDPLSHAAKRIGYEDMSDYTRIIYDKN